LELDRARELAVRLGAEAARTDDLVGTAAQARMAQVVGAELGLRAGARTRLVAQAVGTQQAIAAERRRSGPDPRRVVPAVSESELAEAWLVHLHARADAAVALALADQHAAWRSAFVGVGRRVSGRDLTGHARAGLEYGRAARAFVESLP
jgi:hypothetical protein